MSNHTITGEFPKSTVMLVKVHRSQWQRIVRQLQKVVTNHGSAQLPPYHRGSSAQLLVIRAAAEDLRSYFLFFSFFFTMGASLEEKKGRVPEECHGLVEQ